MYFSSNTGSGIFEVDRDSLVAVLDRTGADACVFTSNPQCVAASHPSMLPKGCAMRVRTHLC